MVTENLYFRINFSSSYDHFNVTWKQKALYILSRVAYELKLDYE
jgi:hypothetical protein